VPWPICGWTCRPCREETISYVDKYRRSGERCEGILLTEWAIGHTGDIRWKKFGRIFIQMLKIEDIQRGMWAFSGQDGTISQDFRFLPDGFLGGYSHKNEHRWKYEDGKIILLDSEGRLSTVFSPVEDLPSEGSGRVLKFVGTSGHSGRTLVRREPSIGCFLRTHFWDDCVGKVFGRLQTVWDGEAGVLSDRTRGFTLPQSIREIGHTANDFRHIGLTAHLTMPRWNGDYPLYYLALNTSHDYFVVCEYDLVFNNIGLRAAVEKMVADGMDCVGYQLSKRSYHWGWAQNQDKWLKAELEQAKSSENYEIYGMMFPFVFLSRSAALYLYSRRLQITHLLQTGRVAEVWPFCESFVPTELKRAGFRMAALQPYVPAGAFYDWGNLRSWPEADQSTASIIHPVLSGDRFASRLVTIGEEESKTQEKSLAEWLRAQLSRPMDEPDRASVLKAIEAAK
jgi:hypothetical protein